MMEEQENYTITLPEAAPSPYPAIGFQEFEHYANFTVAFGPGTFFVQSVTAEQMNNICHQWLGRHKQEK